MFFSRWFNVQRRKTYSIDPDEVILDAFNLPSFDRAQFEGRMVQPVSPRSLALFLFVIMCVVGGFSVRAFQLQVLEGAEYRMLSESNRLTQQIIFAERGVLFDRFGRELAWNQSAEDGQEGAPSLRKYYAQEGFGHILGYVSYPETDTSGKWWRLEYKGIAGAERMFNELLSGTNGHVLTEVDASGVIQHEQVVDVAEAGKDVTLSIDADMQRALYTAIKNGAERSGFVGGAAGIIDVHTGELLAIVSFPEYSSQVLSDGEPRETIVGYNANSGKPFLNRYVMGEYAPGSIVKPYVSLAALTEDVISPTKQILSTGALVLPNPYNPSQPSIFRDWKAHGWVDMYEAIANSSDVYFYEVGGGFENQPGLGIVRLKKYAEMFGFGEITGYDLEYESLGNVPSPEWKEEVFGEDNPWLIGNTYHTSIGQFGFLVTPLQVLRYVAALANNGTMLTPHIQSGEPVVSHTIDIAQEDFDVVHEGMRRAVDHGTAVSINMTGIDLAGKTGTAEVGSRNEYMNSWAMGYWPCSATACEPQFAFAAVLERAPAGTLAGVAPAMRPFFEWLVQNEPEYVAGRYPDKYEGEDGTSGTP